MSPLEELAAALPQALTTDPERLRAVQSDESGWAATGRPLALVEASDVGQVQEVMRWATRYRIPVVPRGAGTGLAGGANGSEGALVLDVSGLDRILEVSVPDQLAVVEPGVVNQSLDERLAGHGLRFAPDPASRAISTIGGNIATGAGGLLCTKYGVTREAVLGLKVVLADGRLVSVGRRTVKGVTGYDLTALFVGSEGTLGIIVEATLKLTPIPPGEVVTVGALFDDIATAAAACQAVTAARLRPAIMELVDSPTLGLLRRRFGERFVADALGSAAGGAFLLVQTDGAGARDEAEEAMRLVAAHGGRGRVAPDPETGERMLALRRGVHGANAASGGVLIEDVAVPRSLMVEMFDEIARIAAHHGVTVTTAAHAGDGNLHPCFLFERGQVPDRVWRAAGEIFEAALRLGGTLTGEHGVGVLKRRWLEQELGHDVSELQRSIKAVFDPHGLLNPGTIFPR